jgi:hypothetical protein
MPIIPIFGTGSHGKSPAITAQRRLNCYLEQYGQDADKTQLALIGRPGLTRIGYSASGPIRGFSEQFTYNNAGSSADLIFAAHGTQFETFSPGLGIANNTLFRTTTGPVYWAYNGTQGMAVDGLTGYVIAVPAFTTTVLQDFPAVSFPAGATSICFIASRFVCPDPSVNGRFRWSAINDGTSWASLDFATAESSADPLRFVAESNGELLLIGRDTIEFWAPVTDTRIFARVGGAGIDWGISALNSVQKVNGGTCFVGRSRAGGERQALFLQGHTVQPISSPDVTAAINTSITPDAATGCAFVIAGHPFYVLNLPETSWCFDFQNGTWDELNTDGGRWSVDRVQAAFGLIVAGDYRDGRIYKLDVTNYTDDGNPLIAEIISKHVLSDYEYVSIRELYADFEVGDGLTNVVPSVTSYAVQFNGTSSYCSMSDAPQYICNTYQTVEFWFNPTSFGAGIRCLASKWTMGTQAAWAISTVSNLNPAIASIQVAIALKQTDLGVNYAQTTLPCLNLGIWQHIAVVFDGTQAEANIVAVYVNGAFQATTITGTIPIAILTCTASVDVCQWPSGVFGAPGIYDEFRMWNTSRTQAQIQSLLHQPALGTELGLIALLHFDEGTGTVSTADSSPFHNNALFTGVPIWVNNTGVIFYQLAQGYNPQAMLQLSKDGGRTWGNEVWQSMGVSGAYRARARWLNLGMSRDIILKLRMSDPTKRVLTQAAMLVT